MKGGTNMTVDLNRVKAERVAHNMTQEQLATKIGWKRAKYAKREAGIISLGANELALIAGALDIDDLGIFFAKTVDKRERGEK